MEPSVLNTTPMLGAEAPDLTLLGLILQADIVVKAVMVLLVLASIWSWAIIFEKIVRLRRARARADAFEEQFWAGGSLEDLYDQLGQNPRESLAAVFAGAMREWRMAVERGLPDDSQLRVGLQQRIERVMSVAQTRELTRLERNLSFLATTGSVAPFIGLFGTVWGIMNAFTSIAAEANTSLAVVAPGIAEALFATALGLVAAIPATIGFNKLNSDLTRYGQRLESFAGEFSAILSRQIEEAA